MRRLADIPWARVSVEGLVIVISILLAFGIDAWWEERRTRHDEKVYLDSLSSALIIQQSKIDEALQLANALRDSSREILNAAVDSDISLADSELDVLLERLTWHVVSPVSPELRWLLSENSIGLVSNPTLVYELGQLLFNLAEFERAHSAAIDFHFDEMMPYLRRHVSLPQLNNLSMPDPGTNDDYPTSQLKLSSNISHQALLQDKLFVNLIMDLDWQLTNVIEWRTTVIESGDASGLVRILNLLEENR